MIVEIEAENRWNRSKSALSKKRKRAKRGEKPKPTTTIKQAHLPMLMQAQQRGNQVKEEGGWATLGARAPRARPHPPPCQLGPASMCRQ
jgi:hypothetical protein